MTQQITAGPAKHTEVTSGYGRKKREKGGPSGDTTDQRKMDDTNQERRMGHGDGC